MDRREPTGPQFTLLAGRHASTGSAAERIGTLVFIPGGPGDSGVSMLPGLWDVLPQELKRRFDLVTWDPRGAGGTTPALRPCAYQRDSANPYRTGAVNWRSWGDQSRAQASEFEAACQVENAAIIAHLGTNENASDLDALRAALGEDRLSFWGVSFGTRIGAVYALTFPDRVRAMLLDGPMDPTSGWPPAEYYSPAGVKGFQWVARYFPTAGRQFQQVLAEVAQHPVRLTKDLWIDRFTVPSYVYSQEADQGNYAALADRIAELHDAVFARGARQRAARGLVELRMGAFLYGTLLSGTNWIGRTTFCLDTDARPTIEEALPLTRTLARRYDPYVGALTMVNGPVSCHGYTMTPDPIPLAANGSGPAVPMLVYGSTEDPRTPGLGIRALTGAFPGARSVTYRGSQHMTWNIITSRCMTRPGVSFLLTAQAPTRDITCPNTYRGPAEFVE